MNTTDTHVWAPSNTGNLAHAFLSTNAGGRIVAACRSTITRDKDAILRDAETMRDASTRLCGRCETLHTAYLDRIAASMEPATEAHDLGYIAPATENTPAEETTAPCHDCGQQTGHTWSCHYSRNVVPTSDTPVVDITELNATPATETPAVEPTAAQPVRDVTPPVVRKHKLNNKMIAALLDTTDNALNHTTPATTGHALHARGLVTPRTRHTGKRHLLTPLGQSVAVALGASPAN